MEKVYISEILADLIPGFLATRESEFVEMQKLVDAKNFEGIVKMGHKLKGSSLNYGFKTLGALALDFEQAGKENNLTKAQSIIPKMRNHLKNIEIVIVNDED